MKINKLQIIFLLIGLLFISYRILFSDFIFIDDKKIDLHILSLVANIMLYGLLEPSVEIKFIGYVEYWFYAVSISICIYFISKKLLIDRPPRHLLSKCYPSTGGEQMKKFPSCGGVSALPDGVVFIPFLVSIIMQSCIIYETMSGPIGLLLILLSAIFLINYYYKMQSKNSTYKGIIPMGIFLGLLGITRQDMITYMWGLFFWAMFWAGMADVEGLGLSLLKRAIKGLKQGLFLTLIIGTIMLLICLLYPLISIEYIAEQIIQPFYKYSKINLPAPINIYGMLFYLPILLAILSLIVLIYKNRKRIIKANTPLFWNEMLIINLTLNIFNYTLLGDSLSFLVPSILISSLTIFNLIYKK
jgi:hypothetical protein